MKNKTNLACVVCLCEKSERSEGSQPVTGISLSLEASCTKAEWHFLCITLRVQAETSAKYKPLAVKWRCFVLQIIIAGKGPVEATDFFCFLEILFYDQIIQEM